jgi:dATP pyrophosphohydrolase
MRAPMQVLVIPFKIENNIPLFCIFRRSDAGWWQFIAGGGEDNETPIKAAKRETFEEADIVADRLYQLTSRFYVPANCISEKHRKNWSTDTYVIPEYCFVFQTDNEIKISHEHMEYRWVSYENAINILHWETNKTALYELNCRIENNMW